MRQDESVLIQEAQAVAREQVRSQGRALPAAYLLVRRNPQTGAPLTHPTAIASHADAPFSNQEDFERFTGRVRGEAARLEAVAVVLAAEAVAELDAAGGGVRPQRVVVLRLEDGQGARWIHAPVLRDAAGAWDLGEFYETPPEADDLDEPLLPRT